MPKLVSKWNYPTTVRFGQGRISELPDVLAATGIKRPLFVTDPGLARLPVVASTLKILADAKVPHAVFSEVKPNPVESNLTAGIAAFKKGKHDGVIAFGGGSALDLGKLIAFQAGQTRPVWDFEDVGDWWTRADSDAIAPIIAVPTTAGTGSEVGRAGVITNEETHTKKVIFHPEAAAGDRHCRPGADGRHAALHHRRHRHGRAGALPRGLLGARLPSDGRRHRAGRHPAGVREPAESVCQRQGHHRARPYDERCGHGRDRLPERARRHPFAVASVGALYDTHHGMTNAVFMPYVLAFNRDAIEERIARLAAYIGIKGGFDGFAKAVLKLRKELNVPHTLPGLIKGLDMDKKRKALIADMAIVDPTAGGNPVKLTKKAALKLLDDAISGTV